MTDPTTPAPSEPTPGTPDVTPPPVASEPSAPQPVDLGKETPTADAAPAPAPTPYGYETPAPGGYPGAYPAAPPPYAGAPSKTPLLSILSLVAGGVSFLFGWLPFLIPFVGGVLGLVVPIGAVVLGFLGKKREPNAAKGLWMTGIILGFIGIVVSLSALLFWIVLAIAGQNDSSITPYNYFD